MSLISSLDTISQPMSFALIGGLQVVIFSFAFLRIIQVKISMFKSEQISLLPLESFISIACWHGILSGLTIMFTGVLKIYSFSTFNSLIASFILALTTGFPMWIIVKGLLIEVQLGKLEEIIPGQFND